MNRTDRGIGHCSRFASAESRDAEIGNLDSTVFKKHYVLRLDIAVNDALVMGVLKRAENLRCKMHGLLPRYNALLLNILLERDALDILHNYILELVAVADIINLDYVRMREHSYRLGFILESAAELLACKELILENFDGNRPVVDIVVGLIDNRHSANANDFLKFIPSVKSFSDIIIH